MLFSLATSVSATIMKLLHTVCMCCVFVQLALETVKNIRMVTSFGLEDWFYESFSKEVQGVYK